MRSRQDWQRLPGLVVITDKYNQIWQDLVHQVTFDKMYT